MLDGYLTVGEAAVRVGRQARILRRWAQQGKIEGAVKFGGIYWIPETSLAHVQIRKYRRTEPMTEKDGAE